MKEIIIFILSVLILSSCTKSDMVQISGRIENGDSIVSIWVEDSIYTFPLDEQDFFSGKIPLKHNGYATLLHNSLNLYLSPREDLEIYVNARNFSASLYFRGSLGGINSYLKEQEVAVFFDKDYYVLEEEEFVGRMKELIDEKIKLLEAKNFDESFTKLEKERIRYSVAGQVSFYPVYRMRMFPEEKYRPGPVFTEFLSSFSLNNEEMLGTRDYQAFLLNYVYLQASCRKKNGENYTDGIANYILSTITSPSVKNFLLTQIVYRYIWENNGLEGTDYLLAVFHQECTDQSKVAYIDEIVKHWKKISPGMPAPDFAVRDLKGNIVSLKDYQGTYLYITVWATWCVPCKGELPYLELLQKKYAGRNIQFLTIAIDNPQEPQKWSDFLREHPYGGIHTLVDSQGKFNEDYMIISIPRFILIGPDGNLITSNAPRPSGQILQLLESLAI